ncbi:ATP-binding protein [Pseudoalteromonas luteoviolacea]|nr:ATP-binding protein [Pseudoalteromonas luteoviolacea]AOT10249.1 hypothetical protein S4054249_12025 [Pseudoalteromonas luteoviolacea]AOT15160.1 hypothetical protein S40542_12000 [Pseudoalteromonas luteoviolacea]AOT20076.1 hypothetical protein S4054_12000 [Pseudoalteromonas luteoviolacea]
MGIHEDSLKLQFNAEKQLSLMFFQVGLGLANDEEDIQERLKLFDEALVTLINTPRFKYVERTFALTEYEIRLIALVYIQTLEPDILMPYIGLSWYEQGPMLSFDKLLFLCQQGSKRELISQDVLCGQLFDWHLLQCSKQKLLTESISLHMELRQFLYTGRVTLSDDHLVKQGTSSTPDVVFTSCFNPKLELSSSELCRLDTHDPRIARWYTEQLALLSGGEFGYLSDEQTQNLTLSEVVSALVGVILNTNSKSLFVFIDKLQSTRFFALKKMIESRLGEETRLYFFTLSPQTDQDNCLLRVLEYQPPSNASLVDAWLRLSPAPNEVDAQCISNRYPIPVYRMSELAHAATTRAKNNSEFWAELQLICLEELNRGPEELAKLSEPRFKLSDMVLSETINDQLYELVGRIDRQVELKSLLHRFTPGCKAIFWGRPGTGKSMAAEAIAGELQLPLYVVNLANIASKWIGETEKHLAKLFDQAQKHNAVLMFDEADAVFAKRSNVESSQDKNANMGVSYLLQKMEQYSGLLLLSTNLKSNLDDAFLRRFHNVIEFTMPSVQHREEIWRRVLTGISNDALAKSIGSLAQRFELSAAQIINITESALLQRLIEEHSCIDPDSLARALKRELAKQHEGFMAQHEIKAWLQGN